ncbi:MAG: hypothetical protein O7D94_05460 [Planctomycetota bacterium]|nr:hypothetical protein [Planctomycetota bacterium]
MHQSVVEFAARTPPAAVGPFGDEVFAIAVFAVGILFYLLRRKLPAGLGVSLFVAATTVGVSVTAFKHNWPHASTAENRAFLASHISAGVCVLWALFGWAAGIGGDRREAGSGARSSATFLAWSLVTGIATVVLVAYFLIFEVWDRLLNPDQVFQRLAGDGLWDIAALLSATGLWMLSGRRPEQPVILLGLSAVFVCWTSLLIPAGLGAERALDRSVMPDFLPDWWSWTLHLQIGLATLLLLAAILQEFPYRRRVANAWPDRLDDLIAPYSKWPAFVQSEAVIAGVVLILGVYHVVSPVGARPVPSSAGFVALAASGTTCLFLAYRRWSMLTAELGIALLTVAMVTLFITLAAWLTFDVAVDPAVPYAREYVTRIPALFNAALFGLGAALALWHWLPRFWEQQLAADGTPWTTAGRMIPSVRLATFLITALAVLIAFRMALWPRSVASVDADNTAGRLVAGVAALLFLAAVTARVARRTESAAYASLAIAFVVACTFFAFIRSPSSPERGWLTQHLAVVLAVSALPILALAETARDGAWRGFAAPLWLLALLVLPAYSLWLVVPSERLPSGLSIFFPPGRPPAEWLRPLTLAVLGAVYGLAASREGRKAFLALAGALLLGSLASLYRTYVDSNIFAVSGQGSTVSHESRGQYCCAVRHEHQSRLSTSQADHDSAIRTPI